MSIVFLSKAVPAKREERSKTMATRDAAMAKMMSPDFKDPRMDPEKNPMPYDGKRLIFGGFTPIVELRK